MKTILYLTIVVSSFLLISCNSGSSSKNNSAHNKETEHMETGAQHNEKHAMLNVKGSCEMCKERIEKAAQEMKGVTFASWELENQVLHLNYDPDKVTEDEIAKVIAAVGHDTDKYKADQATYNALLACCKYRD